MGPADTGRLHREQGGGRAGQAGGRRAASANAGPKDALLSQQRDEKEKMKVTRTSPPAIAVAPKNWTNWKKMEIARTPQGEESGTARRSAANCSRQQHNTAQRNVRDPFVYLFVNEGNKTGNLILGLCFPIVPIAADGPHLEMGESGGGGG